MPTADTGNWDLVVEIAASTVSTLVATRLTTARCLPASLQRALRGNRDAGVQPYRPHALRQRDVSISFSIDKTPFTSAS